MDKKLGHDAYSQFIKLLLNKSYFAPVVLKYLFEERILLKNIFKMKGYIRALPAMCLLLATLFVIYYGYTTHKSSQPLQITVLTESLCPHCRNFIINSYARAINAEGIEMLAEITIVPFGNAKENKKDNDGSYEFTCQHGEKECQGNILQNCLFAHIDKKSAQKMLVCVESKITRDTDWLNVFNDCGNELNLDLSDTLACANSKEGNDLMHEAAQKSSGNEYVPWVIVNGKHNERVEDKVIDDILKYACSKYHGNVSVPTCQEKHPKTT